MDFREEDQNNSPIRGGFTCCVLGEFLPVVFVQKNKTHNIHCFFQIFLSASKKRKKKKVCCFLYAFFWHVSVLLIM